MITETVQKNIISYAQKFVADGYIVSGAIAVRCDTGIAMTQLGANLSKLEVGSIMYVDDKNIEQLQGNERAAAVLLFCLLRHDDKIGAAAIVDSENILKFSSKKKTLPAVLDDMSQICGISVRCAKENTAIEVLRAIRGLRNCCFLPDAGAIVTGRTLDEVHTATLVLDKACNCYLLAESKGGCKPLGLLDACLEHVVYKLKYSKKNQDAQKAAESGTEEKVEEQPSAITTDELKKLAQQVKDVGVRMLNENLVQGTWGNISVRVDDKHILCTPSALDYVMLKPEQMAIVDIETMEWQGSNKPTSEKKIHGALMLAKSETTWVLHSHPKYGCILASIGKALPVPEEYKATLGESIPCTTGGLPGTKKLVKSVTAAIGDAPAVFLKNHGIVARGNTLEEAFQVCYDLENACKKYLED